MKYIICIVLVLCSYGTFAQQKECGCPGDSLMNESTTNCETIVLKNKYKLYWQFNCERIWLTLEHTDGRKTILSEVPPEFYPYTYRLGFHLVKENKNTILIKGGCPANGPCIYRVIDKYTGKQLNEYVDR